MKLRRYDLIGGTGHAEIYAGTMVDSSRGEYVLFNDAQAAIAAARAKGYRDGLEAAAGVVENTHTRFAGCTESHVREGLAAAIRHKATDK